MPHLDIRYTYRRRAAMQALACEDATNLTKADRTCTDYEALLNNMVSLKQTVIDMAQLLGRPIEIIDAGCGTGTAMLELLQDPQVSPHIRRIHAITMHFFSTLPAITTAYPSQFYCYHGRVQDALRQYHLKADLLLDVWGAYSYSADKYQLLKQYFQALRPGGRAYLMSSCQTFVYQSGRKNLFQYCVAIAPAHFAQTSKHVLEMKKQSLRFQVPALVQSKQARRFTLAPGQYSNAALKRGNALAYSNCTSKIDPSRKRLRQL